MTDFLCSNEYPSEKMNIQMYINKNCMRYLIFTKIRMCEACLNILLKAKTVKLI